MSRPTDASFGWQRSTETLSCSPTPTPWPRASLVPPGTMPAPPAPSPARALLVSAPPPARGGGGRWRGTAAARPARPARRGRERARSPLADDLAARAAVSRGGSRSAATRVWLRRTSGTLDREAARARERVVHVARAVVARDHALLLQLVLVEVRVEGLDERAKLVSARSERRDGTWMRHDGHSFLPTRRHFWMHSEQKRCRHSITIIVLRRMPRHTGHVSSELIERTAHVTLALSARGAARGGYRTASAPRFRSSPPTAIGLIVVDRAPVARAPAGARPRRSRARRR